MKTALGLGGVSSFPYQLSPLKTKLQVPILAVDFTEPAPSLARLPKSLTKRTESVRGQTNFLSQNFVTYFNKPG